MMMLITHYRSFKLFFFLLSLFFFSLSVLSILCAYLRVCIQLKVFVAYCYYYHYFTVDKQQTTKISSFLFSSILSSCVCVCIAKRKDCCFVRHDNELMAILGLLFCCGHITSLLLTLINCSSVCVRVYYALLFFFSYLLFSLVPV
jgi:hypothetical protein